MVMKEPRSRSRGEGGSLNYNSPSSCNNLVRRVQLTRHVDSNHDFMSVFATNRCMYFGLHCVKKYVYFVLVLTLHRTTKWPDENLNKMLSYRRETALQGALVLGKSGRLELVDNILRTL